MKIKCILCLFCAAALIHAAGRIQPEDLKYLGAFRLPDGPDGIAWEYSGQGLTFYDSGDSGVSNDGFPGSLFGIGHDWNTFVSEIAIPAPVISPEKNPDDLNRAVTLQSFNNVRSSYFNTVYLEQTRAGIAYLPPQGMQTTGKLYTCFAAHMGEGDTLPCHGWCETTLANSAPAGPWRLSGFSNYVTADYIFEIPESWSQEYVPGYRLATGRFRDGGQGSQGPALIAYGPWNSGNPPEAQTVVDGIPLLMYGAVYTENSPRLNGYHHSDEWAGGEWLTADGYSAVIFTGTKGEGNCWYGLIDGTVWEEPYPTDLPDSLIETRGWWSDRFTGQILFYDSEDFARVVRKEIAPWEPQPYAVLHLDSTLYHIRSARQKSHIMSCAFDRKDGLVYIMEPLADGDRSLIHVWKIIIRPTALNDINPPQTFSILPNSPNPFNGSTLIRFQTSQNGFVTVRIYDLCGRETNLLYHGNMTAGAHRILWKPEDSASGIYFCRIQMERCTLSRKMILMR